MDEVNRRENYRHDFALRDRLDVTLAWPDRGAVLPAKIANLSIGGMTVLVEGPVHDVALHERLIATFSVPSGEMRFQFDCTVVHTQRRKKNLLLGVQFIPLNDRGANQARERHLWLFLMDEQRRFLQKFTQWDRREE